MNRQATLTRLRHSVPLIAPSMLKCDFGNLQRDVALLESAGAEVLHLDVMDGHFVPNLSYGPMVIERMRELTDLPFDAHLMISDPARYLDDFLQAGCQCVTFHVEAVPDPADLLRRIRRADAVAGIAVSPPTPLQAVLPHLDCCDVVLVMSVHPGFGGQRFMSEMLEKVRELSDRRPEGLLIGIDGGIDAETIGPAARAGAGVFVVGSAIFESGDYSETLGLLRDRAASERAVSFSGA